MFMFVECLKPQCHYNQYGIASSAIRVYWNWQHFDVSHDQAIKECYITKHPVHVDYGVNKLKLQSLLWHALSSQ